MEPGTFVNPAGSNAVAGLARPAPATSEGHEEAAMGITMVFLAMVYGAVLMEDAADRIEAWEATPTVADLRQAKSELDRFAAEGSYDAAFSAGLYLGPCPFDDARRCDWPN